MGDMADHYDAPPYSVCEECDGKGRVFDRDVIDCVRGKMGAWMECETCGGDGYL